MHECMSCHHQFEDKETVMHRMKQVFPGCWEYVLFCKKCDKNLTKEQIYNIYKKVHGNKKREIIEITCPYCKKKGKYSIGCSFCPYCGNAFDLS